MILKKGHVYVPSKVDKHFLRKHKHGLLYLDYL